MTLKIYTPAGMPADAGAVQQMETCMADGDAVSGVLCADHHLGYSMPVGGAIAYPDVISPSGVGFDIGCGNKAVATSLLYSDISSDLPRIMDEISTRIAFGMGVPARERTDHPILEKIARSENGNIKKLSRLAAEQLGTVGGGNHYVDLFCEDTTGRVWIGVHFGSRGFGHKTASGYMALSQGREFSDHPEGESVFARPILFNETEWLGYSYIEAMQLAGAYAAAGRSVVCNKVLEILGATEMRSVHNHHNYAWREPVGPDNTDCWVIRKGSTPLWPGQEGFVGGSMGEDAVIIRCKGNDAMGGLTSPGYDALWSAPHGAGRVMSRTEAKGKTRKRSYCTACGYVQEPNTPAFFKAGDACPKCKAVDTGRTRWVQEQEGKIDWPAALVQLERQGIHLRGGDADEAPDAYKNLSEVLAAHASHVEVTNVLRPVGVAMAPRGTRDLYKD